MIVLVTGGEGFIGSHIIDKLIEKGHNVISIDNNSSPNSGYKNPNATYIRADIISKDIDFVFGKYCIDGCIHLAAQASVTSSIKDPINDANINILGSLNVIRLCKKYAIKKIIVASSAAIYGNPEYLPINENHSTDVLSQYGLSKLTMEKYIKLSNLPYLICRFSNVYGERQNAFGEAGVVSIFNDSMMNNKDVFIDGDGEQSRDFIYVKDVFEIICNLLESDIKNNIYNISTNKSCTINQLFKLMAKKYKYRKLPIHRKERIGDIKHSILDNSKLCKHINFYDFTAIDDGLSHLINDSLCISSKK